MENNTKMDFSLGEDPQDILERNLKLAMETDMPFRDSKSIENIESTPSDNSDKLWSIIFLLVDEVKRLKGIK